MRIKRMQLAARSLLLRARSIRRLGIRFALTGRLRSGPPAGVRWVHGGRQLMREPLCSPRASSRSWAG